MMLRNSVVPYVREAGISVRTAWYTAPRRLLDYMLMYVQEGEVVACVEGRDRRLHAGDFCLIQPGELHTLEGLTHTIILYVHLDVFYNPARERSFVVRSGRVDISGLEELVQPRLDPATGFRIPTRFVPLHATQFRDTMLGLIGIWQRRDLLGQLESQYLAVGLILSLLQSHTRGSAEASDQPEFLNWIVSFMSLHLAEPLRVADMARRAGLSPSRFSAVFRDRFGHPPHQFLLHLRIQRAQDLLRHTGLTLQQVSDRCGFADVHHFAKTFKKTSGQTPGSYLRATEPSSG